MPVAALTHAEVAGVASARRLRALAGVDQLRVLASAFVAFLLVDFLRLAITAPVRLQNSALVTVMDVLAYVALGLAVWRPKLGLLLATVPLLAALVWTSTSMDALLLALVPALALGQLARRPAAVASGLVGTYVALRVAVYHGDQRPLLAVVLGGHAALGLAVGWGLLALRMRRERAERAAFAAATADARIRADERRALSRELHDVVAHQLSTASLQMMGARQSSDPALLRRTLATVDRATGEALAELRLLAGVLRDDPSTSASGTELRELSERVPPTQAAAVAERALVSSGFEPVIRVPAAADDVEMTVQRTVSRTIDEAAANMIKHGGPRSRCMIEVTVGAQQVSVRAANPSPAGAPAPVFGWGLRSLRERVSLTGGTLAAGRAAGEWVLSVSLPRG